jgi:uncharacterized membrane protein
VTVGDIFGLWRDEWVDTEGMSFIRRIPQSILGIALIFTGVSHLTTRRLEFQAQVPTQLQQWANEVVLASGFVEIALGVGLLALWKYRVVIGWLTAIFFVAIFWGNISQFVNGVDAFGLDSGTARFVRLLFQPLLVAWALLSTGAWKPGARR